jgi:LL-diaminopimelate aminotransferase
MTASPQSPRKRLEVGTRLKKLPPYLFVDIDRKREEAVQKGADLIHLGIGDPDLPTPEPIVSKMAEALRKEEHYRYPNGRGMKGLREAVARWYKKRFSVELDPETEVAVLIGSKEGIGHLPLALTDPKDDVLVPNPGYPPYYSGTVLAGARPIPYPLDEVNKYLPDFDVLEHLDTRRVRLMFMNYPNNPTGATASLALFKDAVDFARQNKIWLAHDNAYSEIHFGDAPPSLLQTPGATDIGVEFHSLSKTFCMTGWRVGFACGNAQALKALAQVKDNYDSGVFGAIQETAIYCLDHAEKLAAPIRETFRGRKELFFEGLKKLGYEVFEPGAGLYVWVKTPEGVSSKACAERILEETAVICTPGNGFGDNGEGYVRFTLTAPEKRLKEALERLSKIKW